MGKRAVLYLICLSLALSGAGCGGAEEENAPSPPVPAADLSAGAASGTEEPPGVETLFYSTDGEDLTFYLENIYGLTAGTWEDAAIRRGAGALAYEIAVLRFPDGEAAKAAEEKLSDYIKNRAGDFAGYAPEQAAMVEDAKLLRHENYLGMFICSDPEAAGENFLNILNTRETGGPPEPVSPSSPESTDSPVSPEPAGTAPQRSATFPDIDWGPIEGEPDPEYPDRVLYTDPENEDMSLYDTGPILAAWESGGADALSPADREIYDAARSLLGEILTDDMSAVQRETAVYGWIVQNVNYDWTHTDVTAETPRESYGPYGGLVNRSAVCLGFATTFQLLMDMADVECITVVGASHGSTEEHAWNMVRLQDQWYCVDCTWDSNYRENGSTDGWQWYFFNVTSDAMARSDHQWDYAAVPEATARDHGMA